MTFGLFAPCYGYERWLPDWEASVAALDPPADEVVIVGDTAAREAWGGLGRFIHAPQHGSPWNQPAAYNAALATMTADWVMHVGVDDLVEPSLVADLAPHLAGADVVAVDNVADRDGRRGKRRRNTPTREAILTPTTGKQPLDACAAFRRTLWEDHPYDETLADGGCDTALWIDLAKAGATFTSTGTVGVIYRLHDDSMWHSRPPERLRQIRAGLDARRRQVVLSVTIMAHPRREALIPDLLATLDSNQLAHPVQVVWDEHDDIWDTGRRSLLAHPQSTHHLVLQDDTVPCRDLLAGLTQALSAVPHDTLLSAYLGAARRRPIALHHIAKQCATPFVASDRPHWGPAIIVPTHLIADLVEVGDSLDIPSYDRRVGEWAVRRRRPCWYTWPSLVDHRGVPSLIGRPDGRKAMRFLGEDTSALTVDWSAGLTDVTWVSYRHRRGQVRRVLIGSAKDRALNRSRLWERVA